MRFGTRLNNFCLKPKPMRNYWLLLLIFSWQNAWAAELLGRISEDDVPLEQAKSADTSPLTYRVICAPEQTDEPDCQRPPLEDGIEGLHSKPHKQSNALSQSQTQQSAPEPTLEEWHLKPNSEQ